MLYRSKEKLAYIRYNQNINLARRSEMRDSFPRLVDPSQECCFEWSMYMSKISNDNCVNSEDYCPSADNAGEDNEVEFGYDFEPITDEYEYYFNLFVDMADLKYKKKNLEILHAQSPSEFMCKKSGLAVLDGEIEVIQQKIDSPYITNKTETTDTDVNTRRITPMSGSYRGTNYSGDDTFKAIKFCITQFENKYNRTPSFEKLWPILLNKDLSEWDVNFEKEDKRKVCQRYKRYYAASTAKP